MCPGGFCRFQAEDGNAIHFRALHYFALKAERCALHRRSAWACILDLGQVDGGEDNLD